MKPKTEFSRGLRKQFPVWYEYRDRDVDTLCKAIVVVCVLVLGLCYWGTL